MVPSIDGRIVTKKWPLPPSLYSEYERTAQTFKADAWIVGRISMQSYAGKAKVSKRRVPPIPRRDFVAAHGARSFAIAIDPHGKLTWTAGALDEGEHVISILTERVPDSYLASLRSKGVSYLFGGKTAIDLPRVLAKLRTQFGIKRLLLEGGGKINGSFHAADLIDEWSVLLAPIADGSVGTPTLIDAPEGICPARHLKLVSVKRRAGDLLWLRYKRKG